MPLNSSSKEFHHEAKPVPGRKLHRIPSFDKTPNSWFKARPSLKNLQHPTLTTGFLRINRLSLGQGAINNGYTGVPAALQL
ncbi:hypothetical protein A7C99_0812 [Trichophyton rubrum]|uniref:Uncharacterized protein n=2 Tax=Trichophyton rubrum TaxID=5551 RepID=A0A178F5D1_TRIRU|nr:hypothetical protein HL42_7029 [Trichophyton rubrum]OAL67682.1 hypothetical protein A7C99_0812 [Trichophyton rubrum]